MKLVAPDYYTSFKCIAGKCRHNCCIGWEIDIDDETLAYYNSIKGSLGTRLRKNIDTSSGDAHFILTPHERCPFLNESGLCDIVCQMGESALCDICTDHPRYRSFFSDRTEIGIGLCCEEAARIILSAPDGAELVVIDDDGINESCTDEENEFFRRRESVFSVVNDHSLPLSARIDALKNDFDIAIPPKSDAQWADFFLTLECLSPEWHEVLYKLKNNTSPACIAHEYDGAFASLLHYFVFRHLSGSLCDKSFSQRLAFAILSVHIIKAAFISSGTCSFDTLADIARMYSAEIEYSDENLEIILNILT